MPRAVPPTFLQRLLARVRRASDRMRRAIVLGLLVLVYITVIPWIVILRVWAAPGPRGFRARVDPTMGSLDRMRSLF